MNSRFIQIQKPSTHTGLELAAPATIPRPAELSKRDWAIFLLHTAAEVEHALLVQYLYAAYSIKSQTIPGTGLSTDDWSYSIIKIAKEEMGHLLCLQNLLRFIGGPTNLDREDFPIRSQFYPFPFMLEKFSKESLSKYLFAEMPEDTSGSTIITPEEIAEIQLRAQTAVGSSGVGFLNHVGMLFRTLITVFSDPELDDFPGQLPFQAPAKKPWTTTNDKQTAPDQMPKGVKVFRINSRDDAIQALSAIARQGEAANNDSELMDSHFGRFLSIYRAFPDNFDPSYPVATNPNTNLVQPNASTITDATTLLWAHLFNVRYRILLSFIGHSILVPATLPNEPDKLDPNSGNSLLVGWIYTEMVYATGSLREIAIQLATLPLAAGGTDTAGPPFELPYTLVMPDHESDRWRLHRDLINASRDILNEIISGDPQSAIANDILTIDTARLTEIEARI
ncbi:MAG: ferritin-like domain-containing protein [Zavarzinella sp.]